MIADEAVGTDLVMRAAITDRDMQAFAELSRVVNGQHEGAMCAQLAHHPDMSRGDFVLVEDARRPGVAVSTTCLIPWRINYSGVVLQTAMLEMVVTHPDYRRRGLVRAQIERFHRTIKAREFDLAIIQGIPFYYRQFGYAYALDHQPHDLLSRARVPASLASHTSPFRVRHAVQADIPVLEALYSDSMASRDLFTERNLAYWHFLLTVAHYPVRLVVDSAQDDSIAGYVITRDHPDGSGLDVSESAFVNHEAALYILDQLRAETSGDIGVGGTTATALLRTARNLGSTPLPRYQWLLRIPDIAGFLVKIGPVLAQRTASSDCAGLSADLLVNLYRESYRLRFVSGELAAVDRVGFVDASMGADGGDLCIPLDAFVRLAFGYRTLDQLLDAWPDIVVRSGKRHLLDILFPGLESCIWMPY